MRVQRVVLAAVAAGLVLAGCGGTGTKATPSARSSSAPSPSAAKTSAESPSATASPPAVTETAGAQSTCTNAQISAELTYQPGHPAGQPQLALLALTNGSSVPCVLNGWASVTLFDAAGRAVPVPTSTVNQPGAPIPVTLSPGRTAFAGIKWVPCDKSNATCGVGNSLSVTLPSAEAAKAATLTGFPKPEASAITMKSLQVGSVQPSTQGVVAW